MTSVSRAHRHEAGPLRVTHEDGNVQTVFKITLAVRTLFSEAAWAADFEGVWEWEFMLRRGGLCQAEMEVNPQNLSQGDTKEQWGGSQGNSFFLSLVGTASSR